MTSVFVWWRRRRLRCGRRPAASERYADSSLVALGFCSAPIGETRTGRWRASFSPFSLLSWLKEERNIDEIQNGVFVPGLVNKEDSRGTW